MEEEGGQEVEAMEEGGVVNVVEVVIGDAEVIVIGGVIETVKVIVVLEMIEDAEVIVAAETTVDEAMPVDGDEQDLKLQTSGFGPLRAMEVLHQQPIPMHCRSEDHDPDTRVQSPRTLIGH